MKTAKIFALPAFAVLAQTGAHDAAWAQQASPPVEQSCQSLAGLAMGDVHVREATPVPAGPLENAGPATFPEHCLLRGAIEPYKGVNNREYEIKFDLRVPNSWNGRLIFQGGGGMDGYVAPAIGRNNSPASSAPPPLAQGAAVVSTDAGHTAAAFPAGMTDARFAEDQQARLNYAYAAIGKVASGAKDVIARLKGRGPSYTYLVGGSNGGRQAMIAAARFPLMFDGVAAGNPAFNLSQAVLLAHYSTKEYRAAGLTLADFKLVAAAVLRQCDGKDGKIDGMIFDHKGCNFDPVVVQCGAKAGSAGKGCLPAVKVSAIRRAMRGPLSRNGKALFAPWTYDAGMGDPSWAAYQTGETEAGSPFKDLYPKLVNSILAGYFFQPAVDPDALNITDYEAALQRVARTAGYTDATTTDFSTFAARGGKMILTTGLSEPIVAGNDLVRWYEALERDHRAASGKSASDFARLFLVPGLTHGGGGPLNDFDVFGALFDWVEKGRAPDAIIASTIATPDTPRQSRPLCAYPGHAVLVAGSKGDDTTDYACR